MEKTQSEGKTTAAEGARHKRSVSLQTLERLSVYRKLLKELDHEGVEYVHSRRLAGLAAVTPAQLRRDLTSFGTFGDISRGYNVREMGLVIGRVLHTDVVQRVVLVGVGDLGKALLSYRGFEERGFHIVAGLDVDPAKIGKVFAGRRCYGLDELEEVVDRYEIDIAMVASRATGLQDLVGRLAAAGVHGIVNFVPKHLRAPDGCTVEHIDIAATLEKLSFLVHGRREARVSRSL